MLSGPFQAMDHAIPMARIAAGEHYVAIANSRDFVCSIRTLDEAAEAAGVVLLSGTSSVPALSGAVVRHLARRMDKVRAVEMAISASNKVTADHQLDHGRVHRGTRADVLHGPSDVDAAQTLLPLP